MAPAVTPNRVGPLKRDMSIFSGQFCRPISNQNRSKLALQTLKWRWEGVQRHRTAYSSDLVEYRPVGTHGGPIHVHCRRCSTCFENQNRIVRNYVRNNEFLMAPLAKVLRGQWSYIDPLIFISLSKHVFHLHFYMSHSTFSSKSCFSFKAIWGLFSRNSVEHLRDLRGAT